MTLQKKRDYGRIVSRLKSALNGIATADTLGNIETPTENYPIHKICLGKGNSRRVLISAGIHGDEPAGIETICSFIESGQYKKFLNQWEIIILPCINPYGFVHDTRENHNNKDLNRLFNAESPPLEVSLAQSVIEQSYFDLTIELHEDCDSNGYYLFQKSNKPDGTELGYKIIDSVKGILPINLNEKIDDIPAEKGVIYRLKNPDEMEWWPMAIYSLAKNTGHCFTLETPTQLPMPTRIDAHLTALNKALNECP